MTPPTSSVPGSPGGPTAPPSAEWTDEAAFERAEDARTDEVGAEEMLGDDLTAVPDEANEADVLEQHQVVGDDDEDDAPRDADS